MFCIKAKAICKYYKDSEKIEGAVFLTSNTGGSGSALTMWTKSIKHAEIFSSEEKAVIFWENKKNKIEKNYYEILDNSIEIVKLEWATKKNLN